MKKLIFILGLFSFLFLLAPAAYAEDCGCSVIQPCRRIICPGCGEEVPPALCTWEIDDSCGGCSSPQYCSGGFCVNPTCTPNWVNCSSWLPDPSTRDCGVNFQQTRTCTDSNNCGLPCPAAICTRFVLGTKCNAGYTCVNGTCIATCSPATCASLGKNCGSWPDGCGNTLNCGSCTSPQTCVNGTCQAPPTTCDGKCKSLGYLSGACSTHVSPFECVQDTCNFNRFDADNTDDCPSQWWNPFAAHCWCVGSTEPCTDCYERCTATGCSIPPITCDDSDGGFKPEIFGSCTDLFGGPSLDECESNDKLIEHVCSSGACFHSQTSCMAWGGAGFVCQGGRCGIGSCSDRGEACSANSECCSGKCSIVSGACYGNPPGVEGDECYDPAECLSNACMGPIAPGAPGNCLGTCPFGQVKPYKACVVGTCKEITTNCGIDVACIVDKPCAMTCTAPEENPHKECIGGECKLVAGCGISVDCNTCCPSGQINPYKACDGDGMCKTFSVCGFTSCAINTECENPICNWIPGACGAEGGCPSAGERKQTCGPPTCIGGSCVADETRCVVDATCVAPPPACDWILGACGAEGGCLSAEERKQTCGPAGCIGTCTGGKTVGQTQCVVDATCVAPPPVCDWILGACGAEGGCAIGQLKKTCGPVNCVGGQCVAGATTPCADDPSCATACDNDGVMDDGEKCDGNDLDGKTCATLNQGFTGGTLSCKPDCNFDTSGCTGGGGIPGGVKIELKNPLKAKNFTELVDNLINFAFTLGIVLAPLFYIIAGFYFVTAAGDAQKVTTAKNIILWTSIGLGIILFARGLIYVLKSVIGG